MSNYFATIRNWIVFAGCFALLFSGCGDQAEQPESKKVISKKIDVVKPEAPITVAGKKEEPPPFQTGTPAAEPAGPEKAAQTAGTAPTEPGKAPSPPLVSEKDVQTAQTGPGKPEVKAEAAPSTGIAGPTVAIPQKTGEVAYIYDPIGKIDPFAPVFREKPKEPTEEQKKEGRSRRKPMTPLEQIALSQLKLVAVLIAPSGNRALVEEASGKGYIISEGTYIGTNSGRVLSILLDRVVVEEEVEDVLGNLTIKKSEMKLQKTPGE